MFIQQEQIPSSNSNLNSAMIHIAERVEPLRCRVKLVGKVRRSWSFRGRQIGQISLPTEDKMIKHILLYYFYCTTELDKPTSTRIRPSPSPCRFYRCRTFALSSTTEPAEKSKTEIF